jgi:hypothetical protein
VSPRLEARGGLRRRIADSAAHVPNSHYGGAFRYQPQRPPSIAGRHRALFRGIVGAHHDSNAHAHVSFSKPTFFQNRARWGQNEHEQPVDAVTKFSRLCPKDAWWVAGAEARALSRRLRRAGVLAAMLAGGVSSSSCNDLTDPLPGIAGTYTYQSRSADFVSLNRNGVVTFEDFDRRTASFAGTFDFTDDAGRHITGSLLGAFVTRDHIYFRFLNSHFEFHEANYALGRANGEIFVQGIQYEPTGSTFTLVRRTP